MTDDPSPAPPAIKIAPGSSELAPFIYFDAAPSYGVNNGIIQIELAASTVMPAAGYASALLVFALHTGLAHERRIFPIAVEKAQGDREYHDDQYRMHFPHSPQSD